MYGAMRARSLKCCLTARSLTRAKRRLRSSRRYRHVAFGEIGRPCSHLSTLVDAYPVHVLASFVRCCPSCTAICLWRLTSVRGFVSVYFLAAMPACQVKQGKLHAQPHNCSSALYGILVECWSFKAQDRPNFKALGKRLQVQIYEYMWRLLGLANNTFRWLWCILV